MDGIPFSFSEGNKLHLVSKVYHLYLDKISKLVLQS